MSTDTSTDVTPMRIDGEAVTSEETIVVSSPFDGHEVGRVPRATEADIDRAVAVALERHRAGPPPAWERAEVLDRAAAAVLDHLDDLASTICAEAAKPITTARTEVRRAADTFRFAAATARTAAGEMIPMDASTAGEGKVGFTLRVPIGVVAAISPFNFPLNLVVHKVAPAIAAGCPVVLKPASATPLTALALGAILEDHCGLPPGWCNVVTAPGSVADHLVTHDDVAHITFTGSASVGWSIRSRAPRKRVGLELGNNAPVIVHGDADVEEAATRIAAAGYAFSGQTCISVQRVYVHRDVAEPFLATLTSKVSQLRAGDPSDEGTDLSALIDDGETERVRATVERAVADGAVAAVGGSVRPDGIYAPTVLTDVRNDMEVCATEIFGPVVGVATYGEVSEAIDLANDTRYGLQAGIFTSDVRTALAAAHQLAFGGVTVNEVPTFRADQMPYGGTGDSGNTKEGPAWAVREMTEERMVVIER
ncbi:MAG: aldehyde dehydrogenase family protein [Acidimicrobiia bacterium]|nr:aldehyde dehydrogenase family protein [Acidimicrobiia bacterium]